MCMGAANERRRYNVKSFLVGWAQIPNNSAKTQQNQESLGAGYNT